LTASEQAAEALGLEARHIPVGPMGVTADAVRAMVDAIEEMPAADARLLPLGRALDRDLPAHGASAGADFRLTYQSSPLRPVPQVMALATASRRAR
jgi:hypothetical protein